MKHNRLMGVGATGMCITAICCFTPILVVTLGFFGMSAWIGWLDFVLLPTLGLFAALTLYAGLRLWKRRTVQ